ncbi:MAG: tRNA dihydrouridine synthase DusB [Candidatus Nanoarchaeia archaeon]
MKFPKLDGKAILAPMAGVTDVAFRTLCREYGVALTYTEFVSSAALVRENESTEKMIIVDKSEKPVGVQLFGSNAEEVVEAAKHVQDRFDIIDVNCGCPAWKVVKTGAGSSMLNDPRKIGAFVEKLVSAVDKPVTVKIRSGPSKNRINAVEVAKIAEASGAAAVTVHARDARQGYSGKADWDLIADVKKNVDIPVIGNGDVNSPEAFAKRLESGVDYIMIGRAAMTNPYIFRQITDYMKEGEYLERDMRDDFSRYLELAEGREIHINIVKNHAMSFTKGVVGGARLRQKIMNCHDVDSIRNIISGR